jgi:hypothetical protein
MMMDLSLDPSNFFQKTCEVFNLHDADDGNARSFLVAAIMAA